ncbi:MAG: hypothetical protein ACLUAO_00860 [Streptococcus sp.]
MTILNKEVSGELVFFGDDALEQVSHLLAKPDKADMLSGTKLSLLSQRMDKSMILVRFKTTIPGQGKNIIEELNFQLFFLFLRVIIRFFISLLNILSLLNFFLYFFNLILCFNN